MHLIYTMIFIKSILVWRITIFQNRKVVNLLIPHSVALSLQCLITPYPVRTCVIESDDFQE